VVVANTAKLRNCSNNRSRTLLSKTLGLTRTHRISSSRRNFVQQINKHTPRREGKTDLVKADGGGYSGGGRGGGFRWRDAV